ncbi:MAG: 30S ribosomal protein S6 [Planctomycetota bacterium]
MRLYEAMFLVNQNSAKEHYEKVEAEVCNCITRHGGEIVNTLKWDERRLAYEIKKQKRAVFVLVHFNAPTDSIARIERQCRLSEIILRALIILDEDGPVVEPCPKGREGAFGELDGIRSREPVHHGRAGGRRPHRPSREEAEASDDVNDSSDEGENSPEE